MFRFYCPRKLAIVHFICGFNLGQGTALVQCTLETKPLELEADYAISLKVEPVEVVYDSVSLICFSNFCLFLWCGFL